MDLSAQETIIGIGVGLLMIDKFIQYAKIVKNNINGTSKEKHTPPCTNLQKLSDEVHKYREDSLTERGNTNVLLARIDERTQYIEKQLRNGIKFTGEASK